MENGAVAGVKADREYRAPRVVISVGREGAQWLNGLCRDLGMETRVGGVDIGVRVEVSNEIMEKLRAFAVSYCTGLKIYFYYISHFIESWVLLL